MIDIETLATHPLETRGLTPLARVGHAAALVRGSQVYIFGGFVRKLGYMFDMHLLRCTVRRALQTEEACNTATHSTAHNTTRDNTPQHHTNHTARHNTPHHAATRHNTPQHAATPHHQT